MVGGEAGDAHDGRPLRGPRPLRDRERDGADRHTSHGGQRLLVIAGAVSWSESSRVRVGTSQATSGLDVILNAYIAWSACWSSLRETIFAFRVCNSDPSIA